MFLCVVLTIGNEAYSWFVPGTRQSTFVSVKTMLNLRETDARINNTFNTNVRPSMYQVLPSAPSFKEVDFSQFSENGKLMRAALILYEKNPDTLDLCITRWMSDAIRTHVLNHS